VRAIVRRAYDLGLIDAAQYRTATVHLVRAGQARGEPGDNEWRETEEPELLAAALAAVEAETPGAVLGLAASLGLAQAFEGLVGVSIPSPTTFGEPEKSSGSIFRGRRGYRQGRGSLIAPEVAC